MVGFVFFPPSPRTLEFDQAAKLSQQVRGRALKVALSVDADDALLAGIVEQLKPDICSFTARKHRSAYSQPTPVSACRL